MKEEKKEFPIKTDKECRKFVIKNQENLLLDKVIRREIYQIDQVLGNQQDEEDDNTKRSANPFENVDDEDDVTKLGNTKKKKNAVRSGFSDFYNFYFDLTKRLKIKMKENRLNFKFRKSISKSGIVRFDQFY